jgi:hypothetical protein
MPFTDATVDDFVLKKQMSENEYLNALGNPPGVLVGGPSVTYTDGGYSYTQLFKRTSGGGTRHRRKRNKKTRKTRK